MPGQWKEDMSFAQAIYPARRHAMRRRTLAACCRCKKKRIRCSETRPCSRCMVDGAPCEPGWFRGRLMRMWPPVLPQHPHDEWRWEFEDGVGGSDPFKYDEFWLMYRTSASTDELIAEGYYGATRSAVDSE